MGLDIKRRIYVRTVYEVANDRPQKGTNGSALANMHSALGHPIQLFCCIPTAESPGERTASPGRVRLCKHANLLRT